jgi:hypothetical protein
MKPRTDLIVNAACLFVLSPLLGMMAVGFTVGLLEILMWTVAGIAGLISSVFFDIDFTAIESRIANHSASRNVAYLWWRNIWWYHLVLF